VEAFTTILSGQAGGMPWEALACTIERFEGPILKPIDMTIAGQRAHIRVPGAVELETTPLRDVVTGEEKEVHIVYPKGGFFWNDGNPRRAVDRPARRAGADRLGWVDPLGLGRISAGTARTAGVTVRSLAECPLDLPAEGPRVNCRKSIQLRLDPGEVVERTATIH
jgi:hypothetical protein